MFDGVTMKGIREAVVGYAARFDPALVTVPVAQTILEDAIATENMLATIKALAAKRVADAGAWQRDGDLSPAHQLARKSGTSVAKAREALEIGGKLAGLPALDAAARSGELSAAQTGSIADAAGASKNPRTADRLIQKAKGASLGELQDECARTKAAAEPDPGARHRAIHRSRFLRKRRTADGAGELTYRSTLEEMNEIFAVVQALAQRVFEKARAEGRREPEEAYLADGLLAAARAAAAAGVGGRSKGRGAGAPAGAGRDGGAGADAAEPQPAVAGDAAAGAQPAVAASQPAAGTEVAPREAGTDSGAGDAAAGVEPAPGTEPAPTGAGASGGGGPGTTDDCLAPPVQPSKIVVRIDWDSLVRGFPIGDEVCEIAGVGPVPVSIVKAMIASGDPFLAAVVTKGVDVVNVAHLGRRPNAYQRSGLEWLNPTCVVLGCNSSRRLEIDHRQDWAHTKITLLGLLDDLCTPHHALKTYKHWGLVAGHGKRPMVPPWDPRHPKRARAGPEPGGGDESGDESAGDGAGDGGTERGDGPESEVA